MTSNPPPGTNSNLTSIAARASESPLGWDDGSDTSATIECMVDEKLEPGDNLDGFGLGPC